MGNASVKTSPETTINSLEMLAKKGVIAKEELTFLNISEPAYCVHILKKPKYTISGVCMKVQKSEAFF